MARIGVIGTTSWGTTLAMLAESAGADVTLWARSEGEAAALRSEGENRRFLPNVKLPPSINITSSSSKAFNESDLVIIAVPSNSMRANIRSVKDSISHSTVIVSATKGLEINSGKRMTQVLEEELQDRPDTRLCALSGPNLVSEIVAGKPSSSVIASSNQSIAIQVQSLLTSSKFRLYTNSDIIGVELGGALKNIVALGAGVCDGLGIGDNSKAAFMTRGLAEITRLGVAAGAEPMTFAGLAGIGDLIATCSSELSRNHHVGRELVKGKSLEQIISTMTHVAEGVGTTRATVKLAESLGVDMPIAQTTYKVLFNNLDVHQAIADLMDRDPVPEHIGN